MVRPRKEQRTLTASERQIARATELAPATRVGRNLTPLVGWHPPQDDYDWLVAEVERRGGGRGAKTELLNDALRMLRQSLSSDSAENLERATLDNSEVMAAVAADQANGDSTTRPRKRRG